LDLHCEHDMMSLDRETAARVERLRQSNATGPRIISVYLNTRWSDEHQRDLTRVFLTRELRHAREAGLGASDDLDWIEQEGRDLVGQVTLPNAHGIALFACRALGLREIFPVRTPFQETFDVAERPRLGPLLAMLGEHASTLVVFVDGETARLVPLHPSGADHEVRLEASIPGHHRRGGWAQLAQSRYARHVEAHRGQHFEAVAWAVTEAVDSEKIQQIILAGHEDRLSSFRAYLPERLQRLVVGHVHAARWENTSAIVARAAERLDLQEHSNVVADVDAVLTEAAKGGRAVAGAGTLDAARRAAIYHLYILEGFHRPGRECERCGALQETGEQCWLCAGTTRDADIGTALVDRVVATGGIVHRVAEHQDLAAVGGVAARLRYSLTPPKPPPATA
jgi:peptide subunit release factor 1 (eRF1)